MQISMNAAISGIQANILRQDVTANNVANVNTPGFEQSTPVLTEMSPAGVRIAALVKTPNNNPAESNTDLAVAAKDQIESKNSLAADAKVIKAQNRMLGSLLDIFG